MLWVLCGLALKTSEDRVQTFLSRQLLHCLTLPTMNTSFLLSSLNLSSCSLYLASFAFPPWITVQSLAPSCKPQLAADSELAPVAIPRAGGPQLDTAPQCDPVSAEQGSVLLSSTNTSQGDRARRLLASCLAAPPELHHKAAATSPSVPTPKPCRGPSFLHKQLSLFSIMEVPSIPVRSFDAPW